MEIILKNLQEKHLPLINELAKSLDFEVVEPIENSVFELSLTERQSVERGLIDANAGKLNSHTEAKKLYGKWL